MEKAFSNHSSAPFIKHLLSFVYTQALIWISFVTAFIQIILGHYFTINNTALCSYYWVITLLHK